MWRECGGHPGARRYCLLGQRCGRVRKPATHDANVVAMLFLSAMSMSARRVRRHGTDSFPGPRGDPIRLKCSETYGKAAHKEYASVRRKAKKKSGINSAELQRSSHAVDRQHIGGDAVVDAMGFSISNHVVEGAVHDVKEPLVDFAFAPEEALAILNPFEVADGDAAGIPEDIRNGENALGIDYSVGLPGGRAVGAFAENFGLNLVSVLLGDLIFDGGGNDARRRAGRGRRGRSSWCRRQETPARASCGCKPSR